MSRKSDPPRSAHAWHAQPVAWLGIAITAAILAGCVWTIVISSRYTDVPVHGNAPTLLGMPLAAASSSGKAGSP